MDMATWDTWHHITKPSRCGTEGRGKKYACLGLPDAFALELRQGNHTPSPGAELRQGEVFGGSFQWCRECETVIRQMVQIIL